MNISIYANIQYEYINFNIEYAISVLCSDTLTLSIYSNSEPSNTHTHTRSTDSK